MSAPDLKPDEFPGIDFLPRAEWGARPRTSGKWLPSSAFKCVVVHHTVIPWNASGSRRAAAEYMRRVDRSRPDLGGIVPYSFVVLQQPDPERAWLCEGRGLNWSGAHSVGYNRSRYGVSIGGNTNNDVVTNAMIRAIQLARTWTTSTAKTFGHRAIKATACPGSNMMARIKQVDGEVYLPVAVKLAAQNDPGEEHEMISIVKDTTTGEAWAVDAGKARPLSRPDATGTIPVVEHENARFLVKSLYRVVKP